MVIIITFSLKPLTFNLMVLSVAGPMAAPPAPSLWTVAGPRAVPPAPSLWTGLPKVVDDEYTTNVGRGPLDRRR